MFCRLIQNLLLVDMKRLREPQTLPDRSTMLVLALLFFSLSSALLCLLLLCHLNSYGLLTANYFNFMSYIM